MPSHPNYSNQGNKFAPAKTSLREAGDLYGQKEFHIYQNAIEKMRAHDDQLPSLPIITLEIRKATSNPNVNLNHLSSLIAKDPSLTAILMKHASSVFYRTADKPKNLQDVIKRLGMGAIESLTLSHSIKSLFVLRNHQLKALYKQAWQRQTLKACMSYHLAKTLHFPNPEDAIVASLLSEVGTLALLSSLQDYAAPAAPTYKILCQHYSKHLGAILLAKWGVSPVFVDVLRKTGAWTLDTGRLLQLVDVINLGLFHTIHYLQPQNDLIPLQEIAAFKKLNPQYAMIKQQKLLIIEENISHILQLQKNFE
ncbi:HDOD domain-containing protein [Cellvibrio sp.]|uniref:HDOD domain-containing protein n=1 Tax=Cellvibrio sp. TaxID=1965322 RepID=UPI0039648A54